MRIVPNQITITLSGPTIDPAKQSVTWSGDWAEFCNRRSRYANGNETEYISIDVNEDDPHILSEIVGELTADHSPNRETRLLQRGIRGTP